MYNAEQEHMAWVLMFYALANIGLMWPLIRSFLSSN
jgi:hypothetical protein